MRESIFLDPVFQAAAEERNWGKLNAKGGRNKGGRRKTPKGMIERGFSRGRRKVGERNETSGKVKVLMANGNYVAAKAVCIAKINESNHNLTQKLERLGLISKVDGIAVCGSEPKGTNGGVMSRRHALPGDTVALETPLQRRG